MNEHEIGRIAAAMNQARPDWPVKQLKTLLADPGLVDRPRRDVFVALAWVACESGTSSPYRVLESGPWWRAVAVEGTTAPRNPFDPERDCDVCARPASVHRDHDGHAFISALDATRRRETDAEKAAEALAYAREAVAEAKALTPPADEKPKPPANPHVDVLRGAVAETNTTEGAA